MSTELISPWMSADELLRLPRGLNVRHELVNGIPISFPLATIPEGLISASIAFQLGRFIHEKNCGAIFSSGIGFIIRRNPDTVRAPDAAFISNERLEKHGRPARGYYPCAPDLAVEVLSPGESQDDVDNKIEDWFAGGARVVWIVNPRRKTVTVYNSLEDIQLLTVKETLLGDPVLPGFSLPLQDVFPASDAQV